MPWHRTILAQGDRVITTIDHHAREHLRGLFSRRDVSQFDQTLGKIMGG
jgi:hypothetical protein